MKSKTQETKRTDSTEKSAAGHYVNVPIACISELKNIRTDYVMAKMTDLRESILANGVLVPVIVRPDPSKKEDGWYELICGYRRFRAAKALEMSNIPAIVRDIPDAGIEDAQLIENVQREDLGPVDEARAFAAILKNYNNDFKAAVAHIGKSESYIRSRARIADLPEPILKMLAAGKITAAHAVVISRLSSTPDMNELANHIVKDGLSVDSTIDQVQRAHRDIAKAIFDTNACNGCPSNGNAQVEMFGDSKNDYKGKCLNLSCFIKKHGQAIKNRAEELKAEGHIVQTDVEEGSRHTSIGAGWTRDSLKKFYKTKCCAVQKDKDGKLAAVCQSHIYAVTKPRWSGELPDIKEFCTNSACLRRMQSIASGETKDTGTEDPAQAQHDVREKTKTDNRTREFKRRFYLWSLRNHDVDAKINMAIVLYHALSNLNQFMDDETDHPDYKGKPALSKEFKLGPNSFNAETIYNLPDATKTRLIKEIGRRCGIDSLTDVELRFLSKQAGHDIGKEFIITQQYLEAHSKTSLQKLARELFGSLDKEQVERLSKTVLIKSIMKSDRKGKVPKEMQK